MRAQQPVTIGQAIHEFIAKHPCQNKLAAATMLVAWQQTMPTVVLKQTESIFVKQSKLCVKISSAPLRQELQNTKDLIYQRISTAAPSYGLTEIIFL